MPKLYRYFIESKHRTEILRQFLYRLSVGFMSIEELQIAGAEAISQVMQ